MHGRTPRVALTALLLLSAALFVVGVNEERSGHHSETAVQTEATAGSEQGGESAQHAEESHAESGSERSSETSTSPAEHGATEGKHSESGEQLAGVDLESTPIVALAVLTAALLALGLWIAPGFTAPILLLIAGFCLVSMALDIREALHQSDEGRDSIVVIASALALLHFGAGVLALGMWRGARQPESTAQSSAA